MLLAGGGRVHDTSQRLRSRRRLRPFAAPCARRWALERTGGAPLQAARRAPRRRSTRRRPPSSTARLPATLQEVLLGVLEGMGYKAQRLPIPDQESLAIGKEFCNRGQCNPTYYTIGTLLKFLLDRRREGLSEQRDRRALCPLLGEPTAGPAGWACTRPTCARRSKAAGFPNFRIAMLDIAHGLDINQESAGVQMTPKTFVRLGKAAIAADLLVATSPARSGPTRSTPAQTDAVLAEASPDLARRRDERDSPSRRRCGDQVKLVRRDRGRLPAGQAAGEGHRRVLPEARGGRVEPPSPALAGGRRARR